MRLTFQEISALLALFTLFALGIGVLVWLSPVPAEQMTPAQNDLLELADTAAKVSFGAIIVAGGFIGSRMLHPTGGTRSASPDS